ncbi:SDR family oxidoreductase [Limimaricola pyoseonensis]|uniref:NADP-dependent 3-hydroxy acid dehydrogenase YdfG n=1 Tax=Limimaricola pyoseonensis TaxID=521013 RepID=A0A1G7A3I8_9RHOB|nr:SDR family oxidoreductase [Limimaricola pyoseonensis]SDE08456.1 NADP-dependent 3-hydroxy acid dehydrogenase YdfG [Limimaricola pyoseonensis]
MPQTILITGASTGIGRATARFFHDKGWNVVATMRSPENETELSALDRVLVTRLDVTDGASITAAVDAAIDRFGAIDVLLNNAGYGAYGPLEAFPVEGIRRQFDTNVIGLLEVTKAVLPTMRDRASGTIVNISSIGGRMTFPLGTLYHGTKFAVEGLSEALHYELEAIGIRVKIVEPGMIATDFGGRSFDFRNDEGLAGYQPIVQAMFETMGSEDFTRNASAPEVVSQAIWDAVNDNSPRLRYTAGEDAQQLMAARSAQDDEEFIGGIKRQFGL